jgi:hypothetical protein
VNSYKAQQHAVSPPRSPPRSPARTATRTLFVDSSDAAFAPASDDFLEDNSFGHRALDGMLHQVRLGLLFIRSVHVSGATVRQLVVESAREPSPRRYTQLGVLARPLTRTSPLRVVGEPSVRPSGSFGSQMNPCGAQARKSLRCA